MKKIKLVSLSALVVLGLVGCSEEVAEKEVKQVETTDKTKESSKSPEPKKEAAPKSMDIQIADNETVKAVLKSISLVEEYGTTKYEIVYEVENKSDALIIVQARNVSADGKMVPEGLLAMSNEIAPGKVADCVLTIEDYEGKPLPTMDDNFEMTLLVADGESWMDIGNYEVSADLK